MSLKKIYKQAMESTKDKLIKLLNESSDNTLLDDLLTFLWKVKAKDLLQVHNKKVGTINTTGTEKDINWDINREVRTWSKEEIANRKKMIPASCPIQIIEGKLLSNDAERMTMIAMLLENVGIDNVIALGNAEKWFDAIMEQSPLGTALDIALDVTENNLTVAIQSIDDMNENLEDTLSQIEDMRQNNKPVKDL